MRRTQTKGASYPRWISRPGDSMNLREVAPSLWVGSSLSPALQPRGRWGAIVDFYGSSIHPSMEQAEAYAEASRVVRLPFLDGDAFPVHALDLTWSAVQAGLHENRPVLLHCQAGFSRSASAAYAMLRRGFGLDHRQALRRVEVHSFEGMFPRSMTLASARMWVAARRAGERPVPERISAARSPS